MGQMVRPIERVALYVPGGTAAYPSTVLMNAIPAKLAGVKDLVIITPVKADGKVNPVIIAAAKVSGVDTIYKFGGAQGVAAIANGTETIEKVSDISTRMIVNKVAFKFKKDEIMNIVNQLEKVIGGN